MTRGTSVGDASLRAMAGCASLSRGQEDSRCFATMLGIVAGRASYFEMFPMRKSGTDQPTIRNGWLGHLRNLIPCGRDLVTISAAWEPCRADRAALPNPGHGSSTRVAEKNSLFQFFP